MQAIVLVGGLGTRLQAVVADVPKPMAPIKEKPFLAYLLGYLHSQGITDVIFSVHYLREKIQQYFQSRYHDLNISYAIEDEPLGTGGAIVNALAITKPSQPIFVLNGDTFVKLDYGSMMKQHVNGNAIFTMALRPIDDCFRYGKVIVENKHIMEFKEKGESGAGLINAGVYLIQPELFSHFILPQKFSIEKNFIYPHLTILKPQAFMTEAYFIDIGIPDDYARAQLEIPNL